MRPSRTTPRGAIIRAGGTKKTPMCRRSFGRRHRGGRGDLRNVSRGTVRLRAPVPALGGSDPSGKATHEGAAFRQRLRQRAHAERFSNSDLSFFGPAASA